MAVVLSRFLQSFVFEVATSDPWVLAAATILALVMALLAAVVPAVRAGGADPVDALATNWPSLGTKHDQRRRRGSPCGPE